MNNRYNVVLLIEDTPSAEIYNPEIQDFIKRLSHNMNIDNVDSYRFKSENNKVVIDSNYIHSNTDNNLVFFISSATSPIWKNGEIYNLLEKLQSNALVNIINLLPKKLWDKTGLDTYSNLITVSPEVKNNKNIVNELPFLVSKDEFDNSLMIPIADINNANKLVSNIMAGGKVDNVLLYQGDHTLPRYNATDTLTTNQEIKSYRTLCSESAFSLAMYLSVLDYFTISDMKYIQEYMLPGTDKSVLAECMLGGISEINSDDSYKIKDNIKQELGNTISASKAYSIQLLMKESTSQDSDKDYKSEDKTKLKI